MQRSGIPHLTQDTNGKVTYPQLDTTNESQEVSPFPAGDHKAHINRHIQMHNIYKTEKNIKDPQKKYRLGTVRKIFLLAGLNRFNGAPTSPLVQMLIKTHRCLICLPLTLRGKYTRKNTYTHVHTQVAEYRTTRSLFLNLLFYDC